MLLVRLEIIATSYHSTIFKTYAFSLYSHLFIYVSTKLPIYTRYIWTGSTQRLRALQGAPKDDNGVNSEIHSEAVIERVGRCNWRLILGELRDSLGGLDRVSSEIHLEAVIERVWRCNGRPRSSELGDALGDRDRASMEMHWEAVIERVWTCTWRPRLSELRDALGVSDRASLDMHLEAEIEWSQRCTPSCDRPSLEMHLQQAMIKVD